MKKLVLLVLCAMLTLTTLAQNKKNAPKTFVTLEVNDFEEQIYSPNVVLIDVRSHKEYAASHIDGAINVEWGNNFDYNFNKAKIKKGAKIAVYCHSGKRSHLAAERLAKRGYSVIELHKGILAWNEANKLLVHSW